MHGCDHLTGGVSHSAIRKECVVQVAGVRVPSLLIIRNPSAIRCKKTVSRFLQPTAFFVGLWTKQFGHDLSMPPAAGNTFFLFAGIVLGLAIVGAEEVCDFVGTCVRILIANVD